MMLRIDEESMCQYTSWVDRKLDRKIETIDTHNVSIDSSIDDVSINRYIIDVIGSMIDKSIELITIWFDR